MLHQTEHDTTNPQQGTPNKTNFSLRSADGASGHSYTAVRERNSKEERCPQNAFPFENRQQTPDDTLTTLIIREKTGKKVFNNPGKVTEALNKCNTLGKYIKDGACSILGRGSAMKVKVGLTSKGPVDYNNLTKLGEWDVQIWPVGTSKSPYYYGTISPVDVETKQEYILNKLEVLGGEGAIIKEVRRLRGEQVRLKFEGRLPNQVAIGNVSYTVTEHRLPPLQCYKCNKYGHGTLTCKGQARCNNCSRYHATYRCEYPPYCHLCSQEGHSPRSDHCQIHKEAVEIDNDVHNRKISIEEGKSKLQKLNPPAKTKIYTRNTVLNKYTTRAGQNRPPPQTTLIQDETPSTPSRPLSPNIATYNIPTQNRFALLDTEDYPPSQDPLIEHSYATALHTGQPQKQKTDKNQLRTQTTNKKEKSPPQKNNHKHR